MKMRSGFVFLFLCLPILAVAHPLDGRIWDTRAGAFIDAKAAYDRVAMSRYVLLGEVHDSEIHHDLQRQVLEALSQRGRRPALAMEQFDSEQQAALTAAQIAGTLDAEALADVGKLDRKGWRWPYYRDLIAYAAQQGWPLLAANLSRAAARDIALGKTVLPLPEASPALVAAVEKDIVDGHCGQRPPEVLLTRLATAQRARDARMAAVLDASPADGAVLIAGAGHVRRDRAVPRYLKKEGGVLAVAYVETEEGKEAAGNYDGTGYDLLWFTAPTARPDPCATPPGGIVADREGWR